MLPPPFQFSFAVSRAVCLRIAGTENTKHTLRSDRQRSRRKGARRGLRNTRERKKLSGSRLKWKCRTLSQVDAPNKPRNGEAVFLFSNFSS